MAVTFGPKCHLLDCDLIVQRDSRPFTLIGRFEYRHPDEGGTAAMTQQTSVAQQLLGTWRLVSWEQTAPDGTTVRQFGASPKGIAFFAEAGHCIIAVIRADRVNYAIENFGQIAQATFEESKATAQGTITYFGRYSIDEADRSMIIDVEASSFPNWNGTAQKRTVEVTDGELKLTVRPPRGGSVDVVWRRAITIPVAAI